MLVLTRKPQERIQIGENITITIVRIKGRAVRVGIEAPDSVRIVRGELNASIDPPSDPTSVGQCDEESVAEAHAPAMPRGLRRPGGGRGEMARHSAANEAGATHVLEAHIGLRRARRGAMVSCVTTVLSATA